QLITRKYWLIDSSTRGILEGSHMSDNSNNQVELSRDQKALVTEKKATCQFIGSAVVQDKLPVRNQAQTTLSRIEDVRRLCNTAGGDLGDLLAFSASGNHALMRSESGKLDKPVPSGLFSLEFPGSQGSHPGHSGILKGDPEKLDSGRLSDSDFARLTS